MNDNDVIGGRIHGYYCKITKDAVRTCPYENNPNFNYTACDDCDAKPAISDLPVSARQAEIMKKRSTETLEIARGWSYRTEILEILLDCDQKLEEYRKKMLRNVKK